MIKLEKSDQPNVFQPHQMKRLYDLRTDGGMIVSSAGLLPQDPISVFVLTCRTD